jgi:hypothetical protein
MVNLIPSNIFACLLLLYLNHKQQKPSQQPTQMALSKSNIDTVAEPHINRMSYRDSENGIEPICRADSQRFALFPIKYIQLWDMYKKHVASFWTCDEVDLSADLSDWNTRLNDDERHFIKMVLGFFAGTS